MSFGQRFLYVGVGGSGQTIGRELERMLRHQICGPNGNKLRLDDSKLTGLQPFELPKFIQTVYIDYAESDLATTYANLARDPKVSGATATLIHALPNFSASNKITNQLRTIEDEATRSWLPPRTGDWGTEPTFAPLAVGAGQYPTIGRAAFFAMLSDRGTDGFLGQFDHALKRLATSKGDLEQYNPNGQVTDKVIILVGGSLSGGTGGGIMYDVIQLVADHALKELNTSVTVVPLVVLPAAFDGVLAETKRRSSRLNAARGLADLGSLIDLQNAPPPVKQKPMLYPNGYKLELDAGIVKNAFLFDTPVHLKQKKVETSIARFALDLVSDVTSSKTEGVDGGAQRYMPLLDRLINDTGLLQLDHPTFVGKRPFALAASVEISDEKDLVAKTIAQDFYSHYLTQVVLPAKVDAGNDQDVRRKFAEYFGMLAPVRMQDLEAPHPDFSSSLSQVFSGRSVSEVNEGYQAFKTDANALIETFANADVHMANVTNKLSTKPSDVGRILRDLAVRNEKKITTVLYSVHAALLDVSNGKMPYDGPSEIEWPLERDLVERRAPKIWQRVPKSDLDSAFDAVQESKIYHAWTAYLNSDGAQQIRRQAAQMAIRVEELINELMSVATALEESAGKRQSSLITSAQLSQKSDATEFYLSTFADVQRDLAAKFTSEGSPVSGDILGEVVGATLLGTQRLSLQVWDDQDSWKTEKLAANLIEGMRGFVHEQLDSSTSKYRSLTSILREAEVRVGDATAENSASARLAAMILNEVNTSLFPPTVSTEAETRISVSFPGEPEDKILAWFKKVLSGNAALADHLEKITFVPRSASDSIAIGYSVVGLGLLDVPDGAEAVNTWVKAAHSPKQMDRLAWRQRLGYQDSIAFITTEGRQAMIQRLLAAAYNGRLVESGTVGEGRDSFLELSLHFGNTHAEPLRIVLEGAFPDKLALLPDAFLETITAEYAAGNGRAAGQVLTELGELVPTGAKTGRLLEPSEVPPLFRALVSRLFDTGSQWGQKELNEIAKRISAIREEQRKSGDPDAGKLRLGALLEYESFWTVDIEAALKRPYNILGSNSLWDICVDTPFKELNPARDSSDAGASGAGKKRS